MSTGPWNEAVVDYWSAYYVHPGLTICVLCGNSGIIHTEAVRSPTGLRVGGAHYCICPNGQAMRIGSASKEG